MKSRQPIQEQIPFSFRKAAVACLADPVLRAAVRKATDLLSAKRNDGLKFSPWELWRNTAADIRAYGLEHLSQQVDIFAANATRAGAIVYRAEDAEQAQEVIYYILKDRKASRVVKAKSMVTEEIGLNHYLEAREIQVVETDLGEFIIQLAGERPSHILGPAIHKTKSQVGRLFEKKLGVPFSDDPELLTRIARNKLREVFLTAHAGITGANFGIADTGSIAIFTNEGNGRMVTTVPPTHIAVLSIEKILPSISHLPLFARLLPRSATGQPLSSYLSLITGTRKQGETTGARDLHIVLLDNGRTQIATGEFSDILKCIRCSACLNVCPVYGTVGGHAYGSPYSGPMGIILTILLKGMRDFHTLLDACTLCGACVDACPVKIPLKQMISFLREMRIQKGLTSLGELTWMRGIGGISAGGKWYHLSRKALPHFWPVLTTVFKDKKLGRFPRPKKDGTLQGILS